jgi:hypothetical protein
LEKRWISHCHVMRRPEPCLFLEGKPGKLDVPEVGSLRWLAKTARRREQSEENGGQEMSFHNQKI